MQEELFYYAEVGFFIEGGVEGENGAGAFEAVACEVEFFHSMYYSGHISWARKTGDGKRPTILHVHLDCRPIGRLAHP